MSAVPQTAVELAAAIRSGEVSAVEAAQHTLARIERLNPALNAFTEITAERALEEAAAVDRAIARGEIVGPLAGVPYAVKNLFDIEGLTTLAGSKINRDDPPAAEDATLITRLKQAGAVLCGALNMGEYAYDFTGENAHVGPSRNPHDPAHMSGGSSGGSGSAVGGSMVPLALGSDTNGSIRVPASLCGTFGLKPTFGRLSRAGSFAFCPSLDHVGPLARSVADLAAAYDAMQGPDSRDPVCQTRLPEPVSELLGHGAQGLRIAVAGGYFRQQGTPQAFEAVERVARALGVEDEAELPEAGRARAAAYLITNAESSNLHLERLRERAADYDPEVRDRMLAGALLPATWNLQAQRFRRWYQTEVGRVFRRHDLLIAPATPMPAPPIGQRSMTLDGQEMLVRPHLGLYTQPISFIGLPVVVVPVSTPGSLPIGVQLIAPPWREDIALRVAARLEAEGFTAPVAELD
ncbi:AtzE family amidohydrolase [Acidihalobacter prosperus]